MNVRGCCGFGLLLGLLLAAVSPALPAAEAVNPAARQAPLASEALLLALVRAGSRLVAVGEHGVVLLSDDEGSAWRQAAAMPTRTTLTAVTFINAEQGWAVGHGGQILHTTDGGEHWQLQTGSIEGENSLFAVWFGDARIGLAVGSYGYALRTEDGGASWSPVTLGEGEDSERHLNHIFAARDGRLLVAAELGGVFISDDTGNTWRLVQTPYEGSLWSGFTRADGSVVVLGMAGHALLSDDLGEQWRELETGMTQSLTGGLELPDGRLVLAGLGGALGLGSPKLQFKASVREDRLPATAVLLSGQRLLLATQRGILPVPLP